MIALDTQALIWAVHDDPRLGRHAAEIIDEMGATSRVLISAMCLWEVAMLDNRGRIDLGRDVTSWIDEALALPGVILAPISPPVAVDSARLPDWNHRDPMDRIIVATARNHGAPLLTADQAILDYAATGHVRAIDARL